MTRRHIWVIEWHINQWEPRYVFDPGARKDEVLPILKQYRKDFSGIKYRLQKYVPEKKK